MRCRNRRYWKLFRRGCPLNRVPESSVRIYQSKLRYERLTIIANCCSLHSLQGSWTIPVMSSFTCIVTVLNSKPSQYMNVLAWMCRDVIFVIQIIYFLTSIILNLYIYITTLIIYNFRVMVVGLI